MAKLQSSRNHVYWLIMLAAAVFSGILWRVEQTFSKPITSAALPALSPTPGHYEKTIRLTLSPPTPGMEILYTLDGRTPTPDHGITYHRPIPLNTHATRIVTLRARLYHADGTLGLPITATYFLGTLPEIPTVSLTMEPVDLWGLNRGIYAYPDERGAAWERPVHFTYLDEKGQVQATLPAGIRIHGNASRFDEKKSWRLYFRNAYGAKQLNAPLFGNGRSQSFKRLILHAGGQDTVEQAANWTLLRDPLAYELGRAMGGIAPHTRPVILAVNGELWGIYHLSERIDTDYFANELGIEQIDWLDTPENIFNQANNLDSRPHWDHLMDFVETHDLKIPEHYAYVTTQIDLSNLIDYLILQIYFANNDWPHNNVLQFRPRVQGGQWQWVLWDFEYGFGHQRHGSVDKNMVTYAFEKEHPTTTGRFSLLLRRLMQNPEFQEMFVTRTADLLNTVLSPEAVERQIDILATPLETAIAYETLRWQPLAEDDWAAHVEEMRGFARKRPFFVRQHLSDYLLSNFQAD